MTLVEHEYQELVKAFQKQDAAGLKDIRLKSYVLEALQQIQSNCRILGYDTELRKENKWFILLITY